MHIKPEKYKLITIDLKSFEKYARKHGAERAQGYYDALKAMTNNLEGLFYGYDGNEFYFNNSSDRLHRELIEFREEKESMLKQIRKTDILRTSLNSKEETNTPI